MDNSVIIFILSVLGMALIFRLTSTHSDRTAKGKKVYNYKRKDFIMTKKENELFNRLIAEFGDEYHIFPQIHLSSVLDQKVKGQNWNGAFRHINNKSVDFVICDKQSCKPLVAIELDDWSHSKEDRKLRDKEVERIFNGASLPLLRFAGVDEFNKAELEEMLKETLSS